ncbi:MAG TPA: tRNA 2-selenouridine(34) synthase MnmH [Balneolaceae bacterium]|nr:tRNA 2-selenouridine(34) synthase MnmH [Balneolaceae bacterium]
MCKETNKILFSVARAAELSHGLTAIMAKELEISEFIDASRDLPVIDVRTPSEFEQGHIPDAHNLPIFSDEERAEIGTLYNQKSRGASIKRGLEIVGPKMRTFVEKAEKLAPDREILVHCWRGGMRSESMAWLLNFSDFSPRTLTGGYKTFRNFVLDTFTRRWPVIVLGGMTGSGKTEVLHNMRKMGAQVIDLEGLAHHKGSAFGAIGEDPQPSNEHFENKLAMRLLSMDTQRPIWVEDESHLVGKNIIPNDFYDQMRAAPVIEMQVPDEDRIEHLIDIYGDYPSDELADSINAISRRLGGLRTQQALDALAENDFETVARLALSYYDKTYTYGLSKRDPETVFPLELSSISHADNARKIMAFHNEKIDNKALKTNEN